MGKIVPQPERMTQQQAAVYCGVSVSHFNDRVKRKLYPQPDPKHMQLEGRPFWLRRDLDAFLYGLKTQPLSPAEIEL